MNILKSHLAFTACFIFGLVGWCLFIEFSNKPSSYKLDVFSKNHTLEITRSLVWYHSRGKTIELESILKNNINPIEGDFPALKTKVKNMLIHRTQVYIKTLNSYNTPVPDLGNWYVDNFRFDDFLEDVFLCVVSPIELDLNVDSQIAEKVSRILDIMEKYQNETIDLLKIEHEKIK